VNRFFEKGPEENRIRDGHKAIAPGRQEPKEEQKNGHISRLDAEKELDEYQIIGNDPHLRKLIRLLPKIARNDAPVMIQGESGTGKELFAHEIHRQSPRAGGPYIKINCANLPRDLVESTLFGHLKGSFTGAVAD